MSMRERLRHLPWATLPHAPQEWCLLIAQVTLRSTPAPRLVLVLDGKMGSVCRAAISTAYTDFTERFGVKIAVRRFAFWVSGHGDITHSKSV